MHTVKYFAFFEYFFTLSNNEFWPTLFTYICRLMEADSSSVGDNQFLSSWSSAETIADIETIGCDICKHPTVLSQEDYHTAILQNKHIIIIESTILLICTRCNLIVHLHCYRNNRQQEVEDLLEIISVQTFRCSDCE